MKSQLLKRVRLLATSERGMVLPVALMVTLVGFSLAGAAVLASVNSQRGTARDSGSKSAIAAADTGANIATMRLNEAGSQLSSTSPCVEPDAGGTGLVTSAVEADGWCPEVRGTVGAASFAYRVKPGTASIGPEVVATGSAAGVSRRITVSFDAPEASGSYLSEQGLIGEEEVTMNGNVQNVRVNVGTNGNLVTEGNVTICGNVRVGDPPHEWIESGNVEQKCGGTLTKETRPPLPPVSSFMPADIATNNSDGRLEKCGPGASPECQSDGFSENDRETWSKSPLTLSTTHAPTLAVAGNIAITLGGGDYWLCRLSFEGNSHLIMAKGAHVRIFFQEPEKCGLSAGTPQVKFAGNTNVEATGYQQDYQMPGLYLTGSPTMASTVSLAGNSGTNEFVLYAPNSAVRIVGNASYKGVIAAKTITLSGNGYFTQDAGFEPPPIGAAAGGPLEALTYVECTGGTTVSSPNENC